MPRPPFTSFSSAPPFFITQTFPLSPGCLRGVGGWRHNNLTGALEGHQHSTFFFFFYLHFLYSNNIWISIWISCVMRKKYKRVDHCMNKLYKQSNYILLKALDVPWFLGHKNRKLFSVIELWLGSVFKGRFFEVLVIWIFVRPVWKMFVRPCKEPFP